MMTLIIDIAETQAKAAHQENPATRHQSLWAFGVGLPKNSSRVRMDGRYQILPVRRCYRDRLDRFRSTARAQRRIQPQHRKALARPTRRLKTEGEMIFPRARLPHPGL